MQPEQAHYRGTHERLAEARREILTRMARWDELVTLPQFPRTNLAQEPGTKVQVDSFLGTANTRDVGDVYFNVVDAAKGLVELANLPFAVEAPDNPTLTELRERFRLDHVSGRGDDVERAVRLRDWLKSLFPHRTPYRMPPWNALLILDRASRGVDAFICVHYSVALVQCCLATGMQARVVNLHRGIAEHYRIGDEAVADPPVDEHVVVEVWSAEHQKWVMLDPDFDCHYEQDGVPLSAWEIHEALDAGGLEAVACGRGPHSTSFNALGERLDDEEEFFAKVLPSYYRHVSVLMRNDFLSDPDGPVTVAHLVDDRTDPILWHSGSDNRLQPHLLGPVVVAQPYQDSTPVLTDDNLHTSWSSAETDAQHSVVVTLPGTRMLASVVLHWPEYRTRYRTSRTYRVQALVDGRWTTFADVADQREAPYTLHEHHAGSADAVRVVQEPGGGSEEFPSRLWLCQVEVFGPVRP